MSAAYSKFLLWHKKVYMERISLSEVLQKLNNDMFVQVKSLLHSECILIFGSWIMVACF